MIRSIVLIFVIYGALKALWVYLTMPPLPRWLEKALR